jgi:hypothetical protein
MPHNSKATIHQELSDSNFLSTIGTALGLPAEAIAKLQFTENKNYEWFELDQNGTPPPIFESVRKAIDRYVNARNQGHSKKFVFAGFNEHAHPPAVDKNAAITAITKPNPFIPYIPISWLKKGDAGATTNQANEVSEWINYNVVDGDICLRFFVCFYPDGSVNYVHDSRIDAKDVDPEYAKLMNTIAAEISAEMKKEGTYGHFGSCHGFWRRKKEKLRKRGIIWRSPTDLNPNTNYD